MNTANSLGQLNSQQLEILKLFSRDLDAKDLQEIKKIIVKYLADKATKQADKIWEKHNWTDQDIDRMLVSEDRTPYNPKK